MKQRESLYIWRNTDDDGWSIGLLDDDGCDWHEYMGFSDEMASRLLDPSDLDRLWVAGTDFLPCRLLVFDG